MIQPDIRLLARLSCHGNDRANAGVAGVKRVENPLDRVGKLLILARLIRSHLAHVTSGHSQHMMGNTGERSFPAIGGSASGPLLAVVDKATLSRSMYKLDCPMRPRRPDKHSSALELLDRLAHAPQNG